MRRVNSKLALFAGPSTKWRSDAAFETPSSVIVQAAHSPASSSYAHPSLVHSLLFLNLYHAFVIQSFQLYQTVHNAHVNTFITFRSSITLFYTHSVQVPATLLVHTPDFRRRPMKPSSKNFDCSRHRCICLYICFNAVVASSPHYQFHLNSMFYLVKIHYSFALTITCSLHCCVFVVIILLFFISFNTQDDLTLTPPPCLSCRQTAPFEP